MCGQVIHILVAAADVKWMEMLFQLPLAALLEVGLHLPRGGQLDSI